MHVLNEDFARLPRSNWYVGSWSLGRALGRTVGRDFGISEVLELQEGLTILREKLILDKSVKKKPPGWFKRRPGPNRTGDRMGKRKTMSPECILT